MSLEEEADYRFAWRWLLPAPVTFAMTGNPQLDAFLVGDSARVSGMVAVAVIDANAWLKRPDLLDASALEEVDCLAMVGAKGAVYKLSRALGLAATAKLDYGLLPPWSPRVVVPLSHRAGALQGLAIHNPGSRSAWWAVWMLRRLAAIGYLAPMKLSLLRVFLREARRPCSLTEVNVHAFDGLDFAQYLGAKGPNRKTVALPISAAGRSKVIIKSAEHAMARAKLANEAAMLRRLASTVLSSYVPALESFHEGNTVSVLIQEYRRVEVGRPEDKQREAARFLNAKFRAQLMHAPLGEVIHRSHASIAANDPNRAQVLANLRLKAGDLHIPLGITHGDFAPWNCGMSAGQFVVYDWEEGHPGGCVLDDAFSYAVFPAVLLEGLRDAAVLFSRAVTFAMAVHTGDNVDVKQIQSCFVLWCFRPSIDFHPELFSLMALEGMNAI